MSTPIKQELKATKEISAFPKYFGKQHSSILNMQSAEEIFLYSKAEKSI
jgi:hypothetical protein